MSKRQPLDPAAPVASLLEAVGLTAHALGIADAQLRGLESHRGAQATIYAARGQGARVGLDYLSRLAEAAGYRIVLAIEKKD